MKTCDAYQEEIMDSFDETFYLSDDLAKHIENCPSCSIFYKQLKALNEQLEMPKPSIEIDQDLIQNAVIQGRKISETRSVIRNNIAFILLAILVFILAGLVVGLGYGMALIGLQIIIVFVSPIIIPVTIVRQLKGARQ